MIEQMDGVAAVIGALRTERDELRTEKILACQRLARALSLVRKAHRLLLAHEHTSPRPGYPLEALELLRDALGDEQ